MGENCYITPLLYTFSVIIIRSISKYAEDMGTLDYLFLSLIRVMRNHGSFSAPFINWMTKQSLSKGERHFIFSLKKQSANDLNGALDEIKEGLESCSDKNTTYILLMKKLELLRRLGRGKRAKKVYEHIKKDISDISPSIREFFLAELSGYRAFNGEKEVVRKISVDSDYISKAAKAYLEMNIGRSLIKNSSIEEGLQHFKEAYKLSEEAKHPSGMIDALNLLAWYGTKCDSDEAAYYAKKALYNVGYFFEKMKPAVFDTAIEVIKNTNDLSLFEVSRDFIFLFGLSPEVIKKKYKKRYAQAKRILSTTFYKSDGKMRIFLRKLNKQKYLERANISKMEIYNLLHSKVKNIRGETIRKIISKNPELFKEIELSKLPEGFICEMAKKKEDLQDGIDAVINERQTLDPFIQARKDLTKAYLERMPKRMRKRFIQNYITMDEEEKKIIDRFARDYIRYNIKWGMRIAVPDEMKDLIQSFHLKKRPAALSYWALDNEEEREKLVDVLKRFK